MDDASERAKLEAEVGRLLDAGEITPEQAETLLADEPLLDLPLDADGEVRLRPIVE